MTTRYPGGLIRKTPPTITPPVGGEGGSAPGVWTLEQASYYTKQGTWPLPLIPRSLYAWGNNSKGELGINNVILQSSPVQVGSETNWYKIFVGNETSLFIKNNGSLWGVGTNDKGQIGDNTIIYRSSPVQVGALTTWSTAAMNSSGRGLAIRTDGTLWVWGPNTRGELGLNLPVNANRSSPVQIDSGTNWSKVFSGSFTSYAIKTDGSLWAWGSNSYGLLGINNLEDRSSPVQIGSLTNWSYISACDSAVLAIKTDGSLWSWGRNNNGQLGANIAYNVARSSPVQVGGLTNWALVAGGLQDSVLAIKTDGTLWTWGENSQGQLCLNDQIPRSSPVQVGALTTWSTGAMGNAALIIRTNGTLWSCGTARTMGQNTNARRSSPTQVGALTSWEKVGCILGTVFATFKP